MLLILIYDQEMSYFDSRTQQAVLSRLENDRDRFHKISISKLYGPMLEDVE